LAIAWQRHRKGGSNDCPNNGQLGRVFCFCSPPPPPPYDATIQFCGGGDGIDEIKNNYKNEGDQGQLGGRAVAAEAEATQRH
jgi:hypothetical protein